MDPVTLPPEVLAARQFTRHPGEHRALAALDGIQLRDATGTGDGTYTLAGRAVVYDEWTTLYDGFFGGRIRIRERIATGALTDVLASGPEVHLNHGHDMRTSMARLQVVGEYGEVRRGGMKLWEDHTGLRVFARLNPDLSHVRDLKAQMDDGIVDQMSFAFRIGEESYDSYIDGTGDDEVTVYDYTISRVSDLFDVCVCAQGAYPTTQAQMRSALEVLQRHPTPGGAPVRHGGDHPVGGAPVTPPAGGPSTALLARARAAQVLYPRR